MKKNIIYLLFVLFAVSWQSKAQYFTESFENGGTFPSNWTLSPGTGDDWAIDQGDDHGPGSAQDGTYAAFFNDYDYSSDTTAEMITPNIDLSNATAPQLTFWYYDEGGSDTVEVLVSTDGTNYTSVFTTPDTVNPWEKFTVDLSNYAGQSTVTISWKGTSVYGYSNPHVDNIMVDEAPSCLAPSSLRVSFSSTTEANLAWTENGSATTWNIEYGPTGFTQGQGTIVNGVTSNPYTLSGLTPRTEYDFYVQADCSASGGTGTSDWTGPYTWTQPDNGDDCGVPIMGTVVQDCSQANPLTLDFSNAISEYLSGCDGYGNYGYWVKITWPASGTLVVHNTGTDIGLTILDACGGNELYCNNNDLSASTSLQSQSLSGVDVWLYFWRDNQSETADICLEEETCPFPTNLAANNVATTSADLSWTENGSASTWNIEYGPAGFSQGSGTVISGVTSNPYTLSGLSQGTDYEFYVQSDCGGGDTSAWVGPASFTTTCGIITPDYITDFANFLPGCWDENKGPVTGPTGTSGNSSWTSDGFANNGTSGSARVNLYSDNHEEWLLSPHFDLSGNGYELNFDVAVTTYSGTSASAMGSDDQVQLLISTDGGNNWSNLMTWDVNNTPSNTGDNLTVDLSAYNQTDVQFAFWASDGSVNDSEDYNFYVDNFAVRTPPSCPSPTQGMSDSVTTNSAQLSWTLGGNETAWNIEYGPAGFTQGNGTVVNVSTNPYTLTGLTPGILYEWYIQADCGAGDTSTWSGPYSFTTLPGCGGKFYDDGGPNNDYSSNLNQIITIYPDNPGDAVTVTFNSFDLEQGWDGMIIKNGPSTSSPIVSSGSTYNRTNCPNGAWTGGAGGNYSADGMSFTSTDPSGALTFIIKSDSTIQHDGWDADVTCNPQPDCAGIVPDYTEDFTYYMPSCWKEAKGNPGSLNMVNSRWTYDGFLNRDLSGSARIYMFGTQTQVNDWFISPSFDLSSGGYELSFKVGVTGFSNSGGATMGPDDFVKLMVSTDGGASWSMMTEWNSINNPSNIGDFLAFDLSNYAGNSDVRFAYYANTGSSAQGGYNFYVDDFVISASECAAPSNLTTTITGTSSAILSWTDNNAGSATYLVEWKPVSSSAWDSYTTAAGATSYTVTGLTANTEYQWRVTSDCGAGSSGATVSGNNFIPTCVPIVPNYLQEFTTYLDECWMEGKGTMTSFSPANSRWTNDGFANNGTTGAARIVLYANPNDSWLISPEFDLSGGSYNLEMDVAITGFSNTGQAPMGADDEVNVQISTDGGITWSVIYTWNSGNIPSNTGDHVVIDLSNYNGFAKFAVVASDGSTADTAYNFYLDNFAIISGGPSARPSYDVNIGQNDEVYRVFTTDKQKMLNVTAYDVSGREIYRAMNVNAEEIESQINVKAGSLIIFRIEMPDHTIIIKKSIKL